MRHLSRLMSTDVFQTMALWTRAHLHTYGVYLRGSSHCLAKCSLQLIIDPQSPTTVIAYTYFLSLFVHDCRPCRTSATTHESKDGRQVVSSQSITCRSHHAPNKTKPDKSRPNKTQSCASPYCTRCTRYCRSEQLSPSCMLGFLHVIVPCLVRGRVTCICLPSSYLVGRWVSYLSSSPLYLRYLYFYFFPTYSPVYSTYPAVALLTTQIYWSIT